MPSWKEFYDNLPPITRHELYDLVTNAVSENGSDYGVGKDMGRKYALNIAEILGKNKKPMSLGEIEKEMILSSALNVTKSSRNTTLLRCLRLLHEERIVSHWVVQENGKYKRKDYYLAYRLAEEDNGKIPKEGINQVLLKLINGQDYQNKIMNLMKEHMEKESKIFEETHQVVTTVKNLLEKLYDIRFS